jgi:hypothetical protein
MGSRSDQKSLIPADWRSWSLVGQILVYLAFLRAVTTHFLRPEPTASPIAGRFLGLALERFGLSALLAEPKHARLEGRARLFKVEVPYLRYPKVDIGDLRLDASPVLVSKSSRCCQRGYGA